MTVRAGDRTLSGLQAVLISNNPYGEGRLRGMGRRARLDQGTLGVMAARVGTTAQAVGLLRRSRDRSVTVFDGGHEVAIEADAATIPVGIDGEAVTVPTPVRCTIRPHALRVRLPRTRPGVPPPSPKINWTRLWRIAVAH